LVTGVVTAAWAIAFVVLLIVRDSLPAGSRWWVWTCATGLGMGLFGWWYVPRLKGSRARAAARRQASATSELSGFPAFRLHRVQLEPRDRGSNTVSSTETPGMSTRS
jgi:hypothetical protein